MYRLITSNDDCNHLLIDWRAQDVNRREWESNSGQLESMTMTSVLPLATGHSSVINGHCSLVKRPSLNACVRSRGGWGVWGGGGFCHGVYEYIECAPGNTLID